jgi:hypothetical protein
VASELLVSSTQRSALNFSSPTQQDRQRTGFMIRFKGFVSSAVVAATVFALITPGALANCGKTILAQDFDQYQGGFKCASHSP